MDWIKEEIRINRLARKDIRAWLGSKNKKDILKSAFKPKHWWKWALFILLVALLICLAVFKDKIVNAFQPHRLQIVNFTCSWLIAIAILVIISFPPLFGHEILLLAVGLIWGIGEGFGIACAGTAIGEMACFFVFKYWLTKHAERYERSSIWYGCLARLMREGGVGILTLIRYSFLPGHMVTAIMSTAGVSLFKYTIAVLLSLPKQLALVYIGYLYYVSGSTSSAHTKKVQRRISLSIFAVTVIFSLLAMNIVLNRAWLVYPDVQREFDERKAEEEAGVEYKPGQQQQQAQAQGQGGAVQMNQWTQNQQQQAGQYDQSYGGGYAPPPPPPQAYQGNYRA
ncbi:hypothetical protein T439DRAFT_315312 [Meredithblackwellia eburnea MCA 4105]